MYAKRQRLSLPTSWNTFVSFLLICTTKKPVTQKKTKEDSERRGDKQPGDIQTKRTARLRVSWLCPPLLPSPPPPFSSAPSPSTFPSFSSFSSSFSSTGIELRAVTLSYIASSLFFILRQGLANLPRLGLDLPASASRSAGVTDVQRSASPFGFFLSSVSQVGAKDAEKSNSEWKQTKRTPTKVCFFWPKNPEKGPSEREKF